MPSVVLALSLGGLVLLFGGSGLKSYLERKEQASEQASRQRIIREVKRHTDGGAT